MLSADGGLRLLRQAPAGVAVLVSWQYGSLGV
jgi:hypothetical protein